MKEGILAQIRFQYANSGQDATDLFKLILSIARETGLEEALRGLESCVFERRKKWLDSPPGIAGENRFPGSTGIQPFL